MKKVFFLVEGQTEETFVRDVLRPHFDANVWLETKLLVTKKAKSGKEFRGGVTSYEKARRDLGRLLADSSATVITTMLDYYGLPKDFPGMDSRPNVRDPHVRVRHVEEAMRKDVNDSRFVPYLSLHEFEALVFVAPEIARTGLPTERVRRELAQIRDSILGGPEWIDEGPETAPSKRIIEKMPEFEKPLHGILATLDIGLDSLKGACPHFAAWLSDLEGRTR